MSSDPGSGGFRSAQEHLDLPSVIEHLTGLQYRDKSLGIEDITSLLELFLQRERLEETDRLDICRINAVHISSYADSITPEDGKFIVTQFWLQGLYSQILSSPGDELPLSFFRTVNFLKHVTVTREHQHPDQRPTLFIWRGDYKYYYIFAMAAPAGNMDARRYSVTELLSMRFGLGVLHFTLSRLNPHPSLRKSPSHPHHHRRYHRRHYHPKTAFYFKIFIH